MRPAFNRAAKNLGRHHMARATTYEELKSLFVRHGLDVDRLHKGERIYLKGDN